jgi:dTDP-4-dehydrorhamnose 3,5-epimerase-like enzyme
MSLIHWTHFPPLGDERGSLVALEGGKTVPFPIQRVYYLFGTKLGVSRGFHAHKKLQQVAVCVTGRCRMVLDDGQKREEVWLDTPTQGLLIGNMVWREMHDFSHDCVLLVLASNHYDENDYIRNYEDFIRLAEK